MDNEGWKSALTKTEWIDLKLSVGTHKKNRRLSPLQVTSYLQKLRDAGATIDQISREIILGPSTIYKFLRLNYLPDEFRNKICWGYEKNRLSFMKAALVISYALNTKEQIILLNNILEYEIKRKEVQQIVELKSRSKIDINNAIEEVIHDRVKEIKRNMMIGYVNDDVKSLLYEDENINNEKFNDILKNSLPLVEIFSAKLDSDRFTILTDEFGQKQIEIKAIKEKTDFSNYIMNLIKINW